MSQLTIQQSRRWLNLPVAHQILIDGHSIGIMKGSSVTIEIPSGQYDVTIQSMIPYFSGTQSVQIPLRGETILTFTERDGWMDPIFTVDILLCILKLFINFPSPWNWIYEVVTNGFFVLWLVWMWCIRKKYFRIRLSHSESAPTIVYNSI